MLFNNGGDIKELLFRILISLPAILIALSVHEYFHGYAAYKQGDMTARNLGRLTLNPVAHIDVIGFLCLLIAGFGWAKPVPINPRNFRKYKSGLAVVSLAGPVSNLGLSFLGLVIFRIYALYLMEPLFGISATFGICLYQFLTTFVLINIGLFVFNLLPIPPLDGSKIVSSLLPQKLSMYYLKYENIIQIVLFVALFQNWLTAPLSFLREKVLFVLQFAVDLIPGL